MFEHKTDISAPEKASTPGRGAGRRGTPDPVRGLHRALGNRALAAVLQRCPGGCPDGGCAPATAPSIVDTVLRSAGQALDDRSRTYMESRFRHDFGSVRLHTDELAARSAQAVGASAYTVGNHVVLGAGFVAGSQPGQRLLAHELTHVIQQEGAAPGLAGSIPVGETSDPLEHEAHAAAERVAAGAEVAVGGRGPGHALRRQPAPKHVTRTSGPVDWQPGMRATLLVDVVAERDNLGEPRRVVKAGTTVVVVTGPRFGFLVVRSADATARSAEPFQVHDLDVDPVRSTGSTTTAGSTSPVAVPVPVEYELLEVDPGTDWAAAGGRSAAIGGARGIGFLVSPPIRGALDPLLPLTSRLGAGAEPLGASGGWATLERYVTSPAKELTPRYAAEAAKLYVQQSFGQSWWQNNFGLTERQLGELPGLVTRVSKDGIEALAPAERNLVLTFLEAHAQNVALGNQKIASPALSATVREGLSALPEAAPFFRKAAYVVRFKVPASAVLDVNATLGAKRLPSLVYEAEMLVFTDARGTITSVRPNDAAALGRATRRLRWAGRGLLVLGAAISVGRIALATPQELPRVLGEEGGGWLGGAGGSAVGAGVCVALGIATEGIGLVACGLGGGFLGGLGGSYLGGILGERAGNRLSESATEFGEIINPVVERAIWGNTPIPSIGYTPPPLPLGQPRP